MELFNCITKTKSKWVTVVILLLVHIPHQSHCKTPLDCYNQPDTCTNTNFSPLQSETVDCEFGCEQYVVTDATGSVVVWRRGCATQDSPRSSWICFSRVIYFLRHEQCWCHSDRCNSSMILSNNKSLTVLCTLFSFLIILTTSRIAAVREH